MHFNPSLSQAADYSHFQNLLGSVFPIIVIIFNITNSLQCLSTHVWCPDTCLWDVPPQWSMAEAATVPLAYATAYYALTVRANIKPKSTVLILSPYSSIGQACINIARQHNCVIFATAPTEEHSTTPMGGILVHPDHVINSQALVWEIGMLTKGGNIFCVCSMMHS